MVAKYRSVKTITPDGTFDSRAELRRWHTLKALAMAGEISDLQRQVVFVLAEGVKLHGRKRPPLKYVADFTYVARDGAKVVEDVKGVITEGYRIKRHLMATVHGVEIAEVRC